MDKPLIKLKSAIKTYTLDQDKIISPEETLKRVYAVLLNSCVNYNLDILETLEKGDINLGIPIYCAKGGKDFVSTVKRKNTSGKGVTELQAQASAIMELIERFSACSYKYDLLHTYNAIKDTVPDFKLFFPLLKHVPDEADVMEELADIPLYWAPAYNLTRAQNTFVPEFYSDIVGTNGLAAGNSLEEAILQGICEIIERHVVSNIDLNKIRTPAIKLDSITHPLAIELINKYKNINMEIILEDFTLNMEIPTIGVIGYYKKGIDEYEWRYIAAGTHTDPIKALFRALTELPQYIKNPPVIMSKYIRSAQEFIQSNFFDLGLITRGVLEKKEAYYMEEPTHEINFEEIKNYSKPDIKDEIEMCVDILAKKGIEILVINKTNPLLNIPVVRIVGINSLVNDRDTHLSIYCYQALCYEQTGKFAKAIEALLNAKKVNPEFEQLYNRLGFCYYKLYKQNEESKYLDLAIKNFKQFIELAPNRAIDYFNLASILIKKNDMEESKKKFIKALELEPDYRFTNLYQKFINLGLIR